MERVTTSSSATYHRVKIFKKKLSVVGQTDRTYASIVHVKMQAPFFNISFFHNIINNNHLN